ncbi:L,D-transpeptidase [Streptomyces olivochromogenes]|uniref:L,D-transpeptidase n=1 Tax=Streptomyces olivochromogenes TaxID=1963 RepID=UPI001F3BB13B|nr:L,D-transpeptidase [Streptomyces olivochromogenes]MCF3131483.1 L,D-transpeptidase [Streptomyces olivochromogenes]
MSDQPPPRLLTETELSARLIGLAAHSAAPAPATGAQVRSQARRRRRGRRALLSTSALAAAALIAVTSGAIASPSKPTASPATSVPHPSPAPVQRVTVDLDAHSLTIEGRKFAIGTPRATCPIGETTVTVSAKYATLTMPPAKGGKFDEYTDDRRWAVTFTDRSDHERLLFFALNPPEIDISATASVHGAIALSRKDGKRVYDAIKLGARVDIRGRQGASAAPDSVCYDRRPITGYR